MRVNMKVHAVLDAAESATLQASTMAPLTMAPLIVAYGAPVMKDPKATCPRLAQCRSQKSSKLLTWVRDRVRARARVKN